MKLAKGLMVFCFSFLWSAAHGATYQIDKEKSIFSVVTFKEGLAAGFAHNHFIYPGTYDVMLKFDSENLGNSWFALGFLADELVVDDPEAKATWLPDLLNNGVVDGPLGEVSASDRASIKSSMLSQSQLNKDQYPRINARFDEIKVNPQADSTGYSHIGRLNLNVVGQSQSIEVPLNIRVVGDTIEIEGHGSYRFTDFGITPYSALLGAIKVKDRFAFFAKIVGKVN